MLGFGAGTVHARAAPVALMRDHGDVVVAPSLKEVVFRGVYTEANARLEAEALRLGSSSQITVSER